jgi:hypothetical protein
MLGVSKIANAMDKERCVKALQILTGLPTRVAGKMTETKDLERTILVMADSEKVFLL